MKLNEVGCLLVNHSGIFRSFRFSRPLTLCTALIYYLVASTGLGNNQGRPPTPTNSLKKLHIITITIQYNYNYSHVTLV